MGFHKFILVVWGNFWGSLRRVVGDIIVFHVDISILFLLFVVVVVVAAVDLIMSIAFHIDSTTAGQLYCEN